MFIVLPFNSPTAILSVSRRAACAASGAFGITAFRALSDAPLSAGRPKQIRAARIDVQLREQWRFIGQKDESR